MPQPLQRAAAFVLLMALAPLLAALALTIRLTSPGPVVHRAVRVGSGRTFQLVKLRSMRVGSEGLAVTASGDPRVTAVGRLLRRTKLDELPQLWNVVRGDMLLVGPRPEDPRYVDWNDPVHRLVFSAQPGVTGPAALAFRDEEAILAREALAVAHQDGRERVVQADVDRAYRERVLPRKLRLDAEYLRTRSARGDLVILVRTVRQVLRGPTDR
jgi:lipopolysaccharide/colanic/teichoic acid biosynthesis glycosyltransferase